MNILIVNPSRLPALKYGGTERVIWGLGKALHSQGHKIYYLAGNGSYCPFAEKVLTYNDQISIDSQVPEEIDVVHLNFQPAEPLKKPYITTFHGNVNSPFLFDKNTVFISKNQAERYHGDIFVHNGLAWEDYEKPNLSLQRKYFHFLGDASWKVKNVKGAIAITKKANEKLVVIGGTRLNFNMGFRFTHDLHVRFKGQLDDKQKGNILQQSKGLIFPVLWHEPFGLAIIESLYFGCPVFGTGFGSLPELISAEFGYLSDSIHELAEALKNSSQFSAKHCHEYAATCFNSYSMAEKYLLLYEKAINQEPLHTSNPFLPENEIIKTKRFTMNH